VGSRPRPTPSSSTVPPLGAALGVGGLAIVGGFAIMGGALALHGEGFDATLMTCIVAAALVYRTPRGRTGAITIANLALIAVWVVNAHVLFVRAA